VTRLLMGVLAALAIAVAWPAAAEQIGVLEICRLPGLESAYAGKPIDIPAGARFGTFVSTNTAGQSKGRLILTELVEGGSIIADAFCVKVKARLLGGGEPSPLRVADQRRLGPAGMREGGDWPTDVDLVATVIADFH
jgi:hypothetical protein